MAAEICAAVMVIGVVAYAVLGGADFGAGFWDLTAGGAERGARVRGLVKRSMGPVWEANHVWLIFVLVIFWTAFPEAFGAVMSTLYVPLFFAAVGIIFRGAAFAIRGEAATIAEARFLGAMFALSSVLTYPISSRLSAAARSGRRQSSVQSRSAASSKFTRTPESSTTASPRASHWSP
jgi:cytochrome bd ubiquinol oxidase subunit II